LPSVIIAEHTEYPPLGICIYIRVILTGVGVAIVAGIYTCKKNGGPEGGKWDKDEPPF